MGMNPPTTTTATGADVVAPTYLLLLGSGPGIGRAAAAVFAARRFRHVLLVARRASQLAADRAAVAAAAAKYWAEESESSDDGPPLDVRAVVADVADAKQLQERVFDAVPEEFGRLEVVLFNAADVRMSPFLDEEWKGVEYDFKTTCQALYQTAQWAMPQLTALAASSSSSSSASADSPQPSFLVPNSALYAQPIPDMFSLSVTKAAQRTLVLALHSAFAPRGVNVALVTVCGPVEALPAEDAAAEALWGGLQQAKGGADDGGGEAAAWGGRLVPGRVGRALWALYVRPREQWETVKEVELM